MYIHTTVTSSWVPQMLPPFRASSKVLIDFSATDAITVLSLVQVCAYQLGLQIPTDYVRSYSSTSRSRRKMILLHCDAFNEQQVVQQLKEECVVDTLKTYA